MHLLVGPLQDIASPVLVPLPNPLGEGITFLQVLKALSLCPLPLILGFRLLRLLFALPAAQRED